MSKKFYLETSVIRSRLFGHSSIRSYLIDKLKNQTRITSRFVKMEFERSFICDLIEFYFVLKSSKSIQDAIKYWTEDYRTRKLKNINYSIAEAFIGIENDDIDRALLKLRGLIKTIIANFSCLIHRFEKNDTDCFFLSVGLDFKSYDTVENIEKAFVDFYDAFKKNYVDKCRIVSLFDESKEILKKIKKCGTSHNGFIKQKEKLEDIANGRRKLSCTTCSIIGDTIIALECPNYAILLTIDKIFEDLCKILCLKYEIISSVRKSSPISAILKRLK